MVRTRVREICAAESLTADPDAVEAVVRIGEGDMRRTLNILQSTAMVQAGAAPASGPAAIPLPLPLTEAAVYKTTGAPHPHDMRQLLQTLLTADFTTCVDAVRALQVDQGLALSDMLREVHPLVFELAMPALPRAQLMDQLADIECNLTKGTNESLQCGAMVGAFVELRAALTDQSRAPVAGHTVKRVKTTNFT